MATKKKYVAPDGSYLAIDKHTVCIFTTYRIVWMVYDERDGWMFGASVGEDEHRATEPPKTDRDQWDAWAACEAVEPFASVYGRSNDGFVFPSMTAARKALAAANEALLTRKVQPAWAVKAMRAGWTPPKGWTP